MLRLSALLCFIATTAQAAPLAAGVRPGEAFTYRLSVGPIEGARARMSVGAPIHRDGHVLIAVQGEAETVSLVTLVAPVNAAYQLLLDATTLLPREVTSVEKGLRNRRFHSLVEGRALDIEVVAPKKSSRNKRMLSREIRDPLSAYFALRASRLADGDEVEIDVLDGAYIWRSRIRVAKRETIRLGGEGSVPSPPLRAIRLEGTLTRVDDSGREVPRIHTRKLVCWMSDDPSRALLRAEFDSELGTAKLELTSYVPPAKVIAIDRGRDAVLPGLFPVD